MTDGGAAELKLLKWWIRRAQGGPPEGWISKMVPDELGDGISASESGPHAHKRRRVESRPPEKSGVWRCVDGCFPAGFPPTCRLASCASESEVSSWRRAGWKKSPAVRRSDGGGRGEGFRKENKVIGRKHGHQKKKKLGFPL